LERGLFDAFFLGEGLRVRENRGRVYDLDVAARPDAITQLAPLAAEITHIGRSPPRTPPTTSRPTWPAAWPASTRSPAAAPAGTS
jgi:hypothetical protein